MSLKGINAYKKGNLKQDVANADPHKLTLKRRLSFLKQRLSLFTCAIR